MNTNYLDKLYKVSEHKLSDKFTFSHFDSINAYLVRKALSGNFNLWINVPKKDLDKFYHSVVFTLLVKFFERNHSNANKIPPKIGEKYQKCNMRYEVVETTSSELVKMKCISRGKSLTVEANLDYFYDDYTKLDNDAGKTNRETFKPMLDFVKKTTGIDHSFSSFQNKFAVVCSKKDFKSTFTLNERNAFPYKYITKNGETLPNLPLQDFMFYVALDYETIQEFIIDDDSDLDVVVFFGNKETLQIQQDINRGFIKQAIFIGDQKPDINDLLKWKWTLPELQYFDNQIDETIIKPIVVTNDKLNEATDRFINQVKSIKDKYGINLRSICSYISYLYPLVILSEDSRLSNRIEDLKYYFEKKLNQVLTQEFSVIRIDHTQTYNECLDIYCDALSQVDFSNNAKSNRFSQLEETEYLLVPQWQTLAVWKDEMEKIGWKKVKVIHITKILDLTEQHSVTVVSLEDNEFFQKIYSGMHNIKWLLYDHEYKKYQGFQARYDNELIEEFKSKDRKQLSGVDYPDESKIETTESMIERIFDKDISDKEEGYETEYPDYIFKEIIFFDSPSIILSANRSVVLNIENNKDVNNKVGDLKIGDDVRIYENQHRDVLFDSIVQSDEHGKFKKILEYSNKWKRILETHCTNGITTVEEIASRCGIAPSTVDGWLKPNSNTKFPQYLDKISDLLGQDYLQIHKSNKIYKSIMIAAGRNLSDEITNYIIKGTKGSFLSKLNDDDIINAISRHNMPIRKIRDIKIVEKEAEKNGE